MPIHEFACAKCGREFEEITFDDALPQCPHCGSTNTEKLMSACARRSRGAGADFGVASQGASSGGCASCSGGNCASCGH